MNNERIKRSKTMVLKCIILHVMPRVRKNRIVLSFLQTNLCFYQTFFLPHFPAKKLQRREGFTEIREKIKFSGICPVKIDHFVTKGLVQYHPELQYVSALVRTKWNNLDAT